MTNILIEGLGHIASYDLTIKDFERYTQLLPINIRSRLTRNISTQDIQWCDILVCVRPNNPVSAWLARKAYKNGRKIITTLDDDLLEITSAQHPVIDSLMKKSLKSVLKISSHVLTTSKYLGEKYKKQFSINYALTDTIVTEEDMHTPLPSGNKIKLLYAAAPSHSLFFKELIAPILHQLYEKFGNTIALTVIGPKILPTDYDMDIEYVAAMPMEDYQSYMKCHHYDIGIAPLFETEACYSKYFNKYIEYTQNNIMGVYSDQLPYNLVVTDGINGLLAKGNAQSWYDKLCLAINNCQMRKRCVESAKRQLLSDNSLKSITDRLIEAMPYLISYKAPKIKNQYTYFMYLRFVAYETVRRLLLKLNSK